MSLNPSFREEYRALLEKCARTVYQSERYTAICNRYAALREKINQALEASDSPYSDAERLIDKSTGKIRVGTETMLADLPEITDMLFELGSLYIEKLEFAPLGWNDDVMNHLSVVLAIGEYENMEKLIIEVLGRDEGQLVIYEEKKKVLPLEKELGIVFFSDAVERMESLFRIKRLFSRADAVKITEADNLFSETVDLINSQGEIIRFEKYAQIRYMNKIYVELTAAEELKIRALNYYSVEKAPTGYAFTMEEDENVFNELWRLVEVLEAKA